MSDNFNNQIQELAALAGSNPARATINFNF